MSAPRVAASFAVGVSGHRVLTDLDPLQRGVDDGLLHVEGVHRTGPLVIVSALAEGADRLVVSRALLRPRWSFIAMLPMPPEEYVKDFVEADSGAEFARLLRLATNIDVAARAVPRREAYARAGRALLDRVHALLVVWDGEASQGLGGTADMVASARARSLPLIWVHAGNRRPGTSQATSLGSRQGHVTTERI